MANQGASLGCVVNHQKEKIMEQSTCGLHECFIWKIEGWYLPHYLFKLIGKVFVLERINGIWISRWTIGRASSTWICFFSSAYKICYCCLERLLRPIEKAESQDKIVERSFNSVLGLKGLGIMVANSGIGILDWSSLWMIIPNVKILVEGYGKNNFKQGSHSLANV